MLSVIDPDCLDFDPLRQSQDPAGDVRIAFDATQMRCLLAHQARQIGASAGCIIAMSTDMAAHPMDGQR